MKPILAVAAVAVLLAVAPSPCFALWGLHPVTKESAKEMGMVFRMIGIGDDDVRLELDFKPEGKLTGFSRVDMQIGDGDKSILVAMKDERKDGHVVVGFNAPRAQLDQITLRVMIPGGVGGVIHVVRVKDFVEPK